MTNNNEIPLCDNKCRFTGDSSFTEGLCLRCSMTRAEKNAMPSLDAEELAMLEYIIESRRQEIWMVWEIMEEPTLQ